ncbi:MAG: trigger factor [Magnetococcales bacterium]|nr:trigger factor [Magnetococcales bacterium]
MSMDVTVEEKGKFDREIRVRIEPGRVDALLDRELERLSATVRLPGFRPGKVPRKLLESRFKDHLRANVAQELVQSTYPQALREKGVRPSAAPELDLGELARGEAFTYTILVQTMPEVVAVGYRGVGLSRPVVTVGEAEVEGVLRQIREGQGRYEAVEGRQAASGDQLVLDFEGFVDGTPFAGGKGEKYPLTLGGGQFVPGFEEQLLGSRVGDTPEVTVTFPDGYHSSGLAGKTALFRCRIHEVRERRLPEIDDGLARSVGVREGGLAKLREEVRERLEAEARQGIEEDLRRQVLKRLGEVNPMELPEKMVAEEVRSLQESAVRDLESKGVPVGQAEALVRSQPQVDRLEQKARERLSLGLLLGVVAKNEGITVADAAVDAEIERMIAQFGSQGADMRAWFKNNPDRREGIRGSLLEKEVIGWIIANGEVSEISCTLEELRRRGQEPETAPREVAAPSAPEGESGAPVG